MYGAKYSEGIKKDILYHGLYRMIFNGSREARPALVIQINLILKQSSNAELKSPDYGGVCFMVRDNSGGRKIGEFQKLLSVFT